MKQLILLILSLIFVTNIYACECECNGDCSFYTGSFGCGFVALVKVISFDDYLDSPVNGYPGKMPYSMTVEVIKKYNGLETRKKIKIWGDDGSKCRPYIGNFKLNDYYLIAPRLIGEKHIQKEKPTDYDFFSCVTDYLSVNIKKKIAYGKFSKELNEISLTEFEKIFKIKK